VSAIVSIQRPGVGVGVDHPACVGDDGKVAQSLYYIFREE
jgi:hypothetical protein